MGICLTITLAKEVNKPTILRCRRADGSSTFTKVYPNLEIHDIAHYVVEQYLGFNKAFYGLLAQGHAIADFQLPKTERPIVLHPNNLHPEALITEHLVNLIQTYFGQSYLSEGFMSMLRNILNDNGLPFPKTLNKEILEKIQEKVTQLMQQWQSLPYGGVMTMQFKVAASSNLVF